MYANFMKSLNLNITPEELERYKKEEIMKRKMRKKLDLNKIGFAIATIITFSLLINKIIQSGTLFCLTTIYR